MVYYIKVRPYVAKKLGVEAVRYRYADGNYLLWDKELRKVDPAWAFHPEETVARIGGLMMDPYRNKEEQQKSAEECTPLPEPTDPAWVGPDEEKEPEAAVALPPEGEEPEGREIPQEDPETGESNEEGGEA